MYWFFHTSTWIHHGCTCAPILNPPPTSLLYHPSGSSQCTSLKHPVSCIEPGLVRHWKMYNIMYEMSHQSRSLFKNHSFSKRIRECIIPYFKRIALLFLLSMSSFYSLSKFYPWEKITFPSTWERALEDTCDILISIYLFIYFLLHIY